MNIFYQRTGRWWWWWCSGRWYLDQLGYAVAQTRRGARGAGRFFLPGRQNVRLVDHVQVHLRHQALLHVLGVVAELGIAVHQRRSGQLCAAAVQRRWGPIAARHSALGPDVRPVCSGGITRWSDTMFGEDLGTENRTLTRTRSRCRGSRSTFGPRSPGT